MSSFLKSLYSWAGDPRSGEKKDVESLPVIIPIKADVYPKKELYFKNLDEIIDQQRKKMEEFIKNESERLENEKDMFTIPEETSFEQIIQSSDNTAKTDSKPKTGLSLGKKTEPGKIGLSLGKKDADEKKDENKPKLSLGLIKKSDDSGSDKKEAEKPKLSLSIGKKKEENSGGMPKISLNLGKKKEEEKKEDEKPEESAPPAEEKKEEESAQASTDANTEGTTVKEGGILKFNFGQKPPEDPNKPKLTAAGLKLTPPAGGLSIKPIMPTLKLNK